VSGDESVDREVGRPIKKLFSYTAKMRTVVEIVVPGYGFLSSIMK
jgi:hypothetical protein